MGGNLGKMGQQLYLMRTKNGGSLMELVVIYIDLSDSTVDGW
jgi:hypothetical protein